MQFRPQLRLDQAVYERQEAQYQLQRQYPAQIQDDPVPVLQPAQPRPGRSSSPAGPRRQLTLGLLQPSSKPEWPRPEP